MSKDLEPNNCIKKVPIFKQLNAKELDEIIMISTHQKLNKGDFIYQAGDSLNSLFVIHRGKIKITRLSEDGREQVIRMLSHGDFLGELALFNESKVTTYAEAIEPSVICLLDQSKMKHLMSKSPELSLKMMQELSNRLDKAEAIIEHSNLYQASAKVARLLLDLEKNHHVKFETTKANLASSLGITPETFSRKLKELSTDRYIRIINNKHIEIMDSMGLKMLINPDLL